MTGCSATCSSPSWLRTKCRMAGQTVLSDCVGMDCHYYPAAHFHRVSWVYWLPWMQTFTPGRLRIVQPILCGLSWGLDSYANIQELAPIHKPATEGGSQAQMLFSFPCTSQIYLQREREIRIDVFCWLAASILRCGSILASVTKKIGPTTYDQFHVILSPNNIEHTSPELFKHVRTKKKLWWSWNIHVFNK